MSEEVLNIYYNELNEEKILFTNEESTDMKNVINKYEKTVINEDNILSFVKLVKIKSNIQQDNDIPLPKIINCEEIDELDVNELDVNEKNVNEKISMINFEYDLVNSLIILLEKVDNEKAESEKVESEKGKVEIDLVESIDLVDKQNILQHVVNVIKRYNIFDHAKLMLLLKLKFHHLIQRENMIDLVKLYDEVFNDKLYQFIEIEKKLLKPVTNEDIAKYYEIYNDEVDKLKTKNYKFSVKYEEGEIIGAKSIYDQWWMARIIKIIVIDEHVVYYVEFLGWGKEFNEFITSPLKLARYNIHKHKYYRKAK